MSLLKSDSLILVKNMAQIAGRPFCTFCLIDRSIQYVPFSCKSEFLHAHEIFLATCRTAVGHGSSRSTIAIGTAAPSCGRGFRATDRATGIYSCGLLSSLLSETFLEKREWTRARIGHFQSGRTIVVNPNGKISRKKKVISKQKIGR